MRWISWGTGLLVVALVALVGVSAALAGTNRQIALSASRGYPAATGGAQYQSQPGQRELQIEVEHLRALAGKTLNVYVGGSKIGTARVSSRGIAEFGRNTETGQHVPIIGAGTAVTVRTSQAVTVVSGTF